TNTNTNTGGVKNPRLSSSINLKSDRLLGSKAFDPRSTQAAVNLKVLIEQMREQVQNIE
ncbi:endoribonuclease YicC domain-containing protein, partial [Pseudomonas aeruginosa]|uniref:endoribonuclease YicC domain-containing protein n=1 Tax=Pseudomonas aeruginosa TaxID=287 RepID=UPI003364F266